MTPAADKLVVLTLLVNLRHSEVQTDLDTLVAGDDVPDKDLTPCEADIGRLNGQLDMLENIKRDIAHL